MGCGAELLLAGLLATALAQVPPSPSPTLAWLPQQLTPQNLTPALQGPFACKDGTEIASSQVCDGVSDCSLTEDGPGGEDEENCSSGDGEDGGPGGSSAKQLSADLMNMGSPCYAKDIMSINQQEDDLTQPMRCMPPFKNVVANQRVRVST